MIHAFVDGVYVIMLYECEYLIVCSFYSPIVCMYLAMHKQALILILFLPTACMLLCLQTADPFAYAVSAFAFPQNVSYCAYKQQIHLLMLFLPLLSHSL
jgi:hypothetical protein